MRALSKAGVDRGLQRVLLGTARSRSSRRYNLPAAALIPMPTRSAESVCSNNSRSRVDRRRRYGAGQGVAIPIQPGSGLIRPTEVPADGKPAICPPALPQSLQPARRARARCPTCPLPKALGMPALAITDHGNLYGGRAFSRGEARIDFQAIVGT
ncbi:MAG: hypothetical protein U0794_02650 [Isosphaeraceae bacterium]